MKKYILLLSVLFSFLTGFTNDSTFTFWNIKEQNKGKFFIYWGYNRAAYTDSDIHFKGRNYDFELSDVKACDRQTKFNWNRYFNIENLTIPQTNLKFGYFINDHYSISIGVDHMKYVMVQYQTVKINGEINGTGTIHDGIYEDNTKYLDQEFLIFEHTDGLNYLNAEINRFDGLFKIKDHVILNSVLGAGAGALMPKTNAVLFDQERYDEFHLAGYGLNIKAGLNLTIHKYFFVQSEFKGGFINMPDIQATKFMDEKASQHFFFGEYTLLFGFNIPLKKKAKKFEPIGNPSF